MESNFIEYDFSKSLDRIDTIISTTGEFEELDYIPLRSKLTYSNGFYVKCSAIFVDIRESSSLTDEHYRPTLAKLYRAFISEIMAIMSGNYSCAEVYIVGDCVSGIFDTRTKEEIIGIICTIGKISSIVKILNYKFKKKGIKEIEIGIGASCGRALMVQAGYKGSGMNDVVWLGDVVNEASKYANWGNQGLFDEKILISESIYDKLDERHQEYFNWSIRRDCYMGDIINKGMDKWFEEHCEEDSWW